MFKRLKWFSVENIWDNVKALFRRFPLVAIDTFVASACGVILIESERQNWVWQGHETLEQVLTKVLLMAVLGFPLLTGLTLLSEKFKWNHLYHWLVQAGGIVLLVIYYFVLPPKPADFGDTQMMRLFIFNVVAYLVALSVPFYEKNHSLKFWRFVETAFSRAVVAAFFSATLWAGIALSLAAIDYLFGVNIKGEFYAEVWAVIVGVFGAWFFLAGFPQVHESLPERAENSRILRIFIQYICIPLLCIFFVILYVYLGKIVFLWDWPKGGVADWILGFSSAGFLVYILAYPLIQKNDYPFLKKFFRVFFALVLPMVAVLFLAIGIRIKEYGVTESRYLVALGGIWLLLSSLYFLFSKHKELKLLPYLVAVFLFFANFGPWGMYAVSVYSQYNRLEKLLTQHNLLQNGTIKIVADENTIPLADRASIHSKIQFLSTHRDTEKLQEWFSGVVTSTNPMESPYGYADSAMQAMNIRDYYNYVPYRGDEDYKYLNAYRTSAIEIVGFDAVKNNVSFYEGAPLSTVNHVFGSTTFQFVLMDNQIKITEGTKEIARANFAPHLEDWMLKYGSQMGKEFGDVEMSLEVQNTDFRFKFLFNNISLQKQNNVWEVQSADGLVLFDRK